MREVFNSRHRSNLVKPLPNFKCRQLILAKQLLEDVRQIANRTVGHAREGLMTERSQTVIDMVHGGRPELLIIDDDPAVGKLDVAGVELVLIPVHGHEPLLTAGFKGSFDRGIIARKVRISVDHKKRVAQQGKRRVNSSGSAAQGGTVEGIGDIQAEAAAIADIILDHFAHMAYAQHHAPDAPAVQQAQLVRSEGLAVGFRPTLWE